MISLKKICAVLSKQCCFLSSENQRLDSNVKEEKSRDDITNQNLVYSFADKYPISKNSEENKCIKLVIIDSLFLEIGKEYEITPQGLKGNSLRIQDGCVYGGSDPEANHIVLSSKEKGVGDKHFMIQFDKNLQNRYAIRDLGQGMGTFIRIDKQIELKTNYIISFGDSHMIILIDTTEKPNMQHFQ